MAKAAKLPEPTKTTSNLERIYEMQDRQTAASLALAELAYDGAILLAELRADGRYARLRDHQQEIDLVRQLISDSTGAVTALVPPNLKKG